MTIKELATIAYNQVFPTGGDAPSITVQEFIRTAIAEYSYQFLLMYWRERNEEGMYHLPAAVLTEKEFDVIDGSYVDTEDVNFLLSLPKDAWLVSVKPSLDEKYKCSCKFIKSTLTDSELFCDDDSLDDSYTPFYPVRGKIIFPKGTSAKKVRVVYADAGKDDGDIEIDNTLAALVRARLLEIYLGKVPKKDVTLNDNPDT